VFWDSQDTPVRRAPSKKEKDLLFKDQSGKCNYCGIKLDVRYFHVDHKTPVANNGSDSLTNKQLLCGPCNTRKIDMTDGDFRRAYKLTPARQAKGPPTRIIKQDHFDDIRKVLDKKQSRRRRQQQNEYARPFSF